jgi:hypothetical protein
MVNLISFEQLSLIIFRQFKNSSKGVSTSQRVLSVGNMFRKVDWLKAVSGQIHSRERTLAKFSFLSYSRGTQNEPINYVECGKRGHN